MWNNFAAFILTHGRPDNVITYETLRRCGYTGPIYLLVDTGDKTQSQYKAKYGEQVILFDKKEISPTFDHLDNFEEMRAIVYARNANFKIAKDMGIKHFLQLDDDYIWWSYRFDGQYKYINNSSKQIKNLDKIFSHYIKFMETTEAKAIAMAQFGDFVGGLHGNDKTDKPKLLRKAMNSWFLRTDRPLEFKGTLNEDVNTYVGYGAKGDLIFTTTQIFLGQTPTSQAKGGMTEIYQVSGTYRKSFYTVMLQPSSVKIRTMNPKGNTRIHHNIR